MTRRWSIRRAYEADYDSLGAVMYDAVHGEGSPYSAQERAAWMPMPRKGPDWAAHLDAQYILLAETDDQIIGFMSLAEKGYMDFAYIRGRFRGMGLFRQLFDCLETKARKNSIPRLWTHASLAAEPAFLAMGFSICHREEVAIGDQRLARCEMEKFL